MPYQKEGRLYLENCFKVVSLIMCVDVVACWMCEDSCGKRGGATFGCVLMSLHVGCVKILVGKGVPVVKKAKWSPLGRPKGPRVYCAPNRPNCLFNQLYMQCSLNGEQTQRHIFIHGGS